jgi:hypothetical protein
MGFLQRVRSMLFITVVIWGLGMAKLVSGIGVVDIAKQVSVVEAKEKQE